MLIEVIHQKIVFNIILAFLDHLKPGIFFAGQPYQARIHHLKEVSQVDETAVFPFVSNSHMFDLSHVSLSELRCQDPRYASDFMMLLIDQ